MSPDSQIHKLNTPTHQQNKLKYSERVLVKGSLHQPDVDLIVAINKMNKTCFCACRLHAASG